MTPGLTARLRALLTAYRQAQFDIGSDYNVDAINEVLASLPPDPGGAMPEPWPGMVVEQRTSRQSRWVVTGADRVGEFWYVSSERHDSYPWIPANIHEIRDSTGRVIWRAE